MAYTLFKTTLGTCGLAWNDVGLMRFALPEASQVELGGEREARSEQPPAWCAGLIERVRAHLAGASEDFGDVRYDFSRVTVFQRAVYEGAMSVRAGTTRTYGWLAAHIGSPVSASRAVGTALGKNPWPLLVPCHRFIGANGKLTGYSASGGLATKSRLLALEGAELLAE